MIRRAARYALGALVLARIYEVFPLTCPKCGGAMWIIAFIDEGEAIQEILQHLGEPIEPPRMLAPASLPSRCGKPTVSVPTIRLSSLDRSSRSISGSRGDVGRRRTLPEDSVVSVTRPENALRFSILG